MGCFSHRPEALPKQRENGVRTRLDHPSEPQAHQRESTLDSLVKVQRKMCRGC